MIIDNEPLIKEHIINQLNKELTDKLEIHTSYNNGNTNLIFYTRKLGLVFERSHFFHTPKTVWTVNHSFIKRYVNKFFIPENEILQVVTEWFKETYYNKYKVEKFSYCFFEKS